MDKENQTIRRNLQRLKPYTKDLYAYITDEYNRLLDVIEREKLPFKFAKLYINAFIGDPCVEAMLLLDREAMPSNFQAESRNDCHPPGYSSLEETQTDSPDLPDRQVPDGKS